ncbi:MAG: ParB/RepB/Spo0J family partition protein [Planctomycetota bacterium]|jgi:ParB family chromosome partitioning protein|nr:ParB/RepB/Spo0J family partition protein [Planctomycetota bacterium]
MTKQRGLGRGLASLIGPSGPKRDSGAVAADAVWELAVEKIAVSPSQPRKRFDPGELNNLAQSIKDHGLMEPLVVRRLEGGAYRLIAGERRLRAIRDILKFPVALVRLMNTADDAGAYLLTLEENLQRADLNPIEEAAAYAELRDGLGMTQEEIAGRLHISRSKVANALRMFALPEEVKELVREGKLDGSKAKAIAGLDNPIEQIRLARQAAEGGLNAREVERAVSGNRKSAGSGGRGQRKDVNIESLEERLRHYFGSKVTISDRNGRGRIIIDYFSVGEAQRILDLIGLPPE